MNLSRPFFLAVLFATLGTFAQQKEITVSVKNSLQFHRTEVVSVKRTELLKLLKDNPEKDIRVKRKDTGESLALQWIDYDKNGVPDELLFVADVGAKAASQYIIVADKKLAVPDNPDKTYARFVPERVDDFAWENDRIAWRVYGPEGQKEALAGVAGATMSSGIDMWLKRVTYPVVDEWYKKSRTDAGYYHSDRGEGYDPYHVGDSRGNGGIGIWDKDSLLVSRNFISYKVIAVGPLRTVFELTYAPWSDYGVREVKRISLDLGSNFSKFELSLASAKKVPNYTIGITLHENKGEVLIDKQNKFFRHWEQIDDSFVGEGIVLDPAIVTSAFARVSKVPDQSNLLIVTKPQTKLTYYAGFAWKKSGQVSTSADWDALLEKESQIIASPLEVSIIAKKK
jgi:hypothetical protein